MLRLKKRSLLECIQGYSCHCSVQNIAEENLVDLFCIFIQGTSTESARKLRRTNSMTSAETELMMVAGESSKPIHRSLQRNNVKCSGSLSVKTCLTIKVKMSSCTMKKGQTVPEIFAIKMLISKTLLRSVLVKLGKGQFTTVWLVVTPRIADEKLSVSFKHKVILYKQHNIRQVSSKYMHLVLNTYSKLALSLISIQ